MALDPGALGTLLIGLDHARHDFDPVPERRRRTAGYRRPAGVTRLRSALVAALRILARPATAGDTSRA
ncbi:MAG TPA: hypothetical protein VFK54_08940 [Candidatus Limnocylindrales bacterium]|nr:hypothetical protein [Candidatus Limnocylindrales bacterium]